MDGGIVTYTAEQVRVLAASQRANFHNKSADALDAFADRLAHEEQESRTGISGRLARSLFTPTEWALIETKEATARSEGRAEVYAEIAKLDPWHEEDRADGVTVVWCNLCLGNDEGAGDGVIEATFPHRPDCVYLAAIKAVGPAAADGVDQ